MAEPAYYDPKETYVIISGHYVEGFAEDDHISVEPLESERWSAHVGVAGEAGWSLNNNNAHKVTIKLLQNSSSIPVLRALEKSMTPQTIEVGNTSSGKYLGGGTNVRFSERKGVSFGKTMKEREFVLVCTDWQDL